MNLSEKHKFKLLVCCMTFNHSRFILDTLNGFCMQETSFPYLCIILDDASTDGEPEVLKKYLEEHFDLGERSEAGNEETEAFTMSFARHKTNRNCFFAVYLLKENHFQKSKNKFPYWADWRNNAQYVATCEGDDYWIVPDKLQRQVEFLESHPDYTMVCNRTKLYSVWRKKFIGESYCYDKSQIVDPKDVIRRTGLFISTCSMVYRPSIMDNMPHYWKQCRVGDYPLQIMCAMKGKVYYFNDIMSVYRVENAHSWMGGQKWLAFSETRVKTIRSRIRMFEGFANDFPEYRQVCQDKISDEVNRNIPNRHISSKEELNKYLDYFSDIIKHFSLRWKIDLWIRKSRIPGLRYLYTRYCLEKYSKRSLYY